ncbi:zinc finger protein 493-like [Ptychodera flava]|uniref:zinc finger protein 493-like n=1 Tax=Ptychodera flava TaxID=63121 RepID=UPI003969F3AA
MMENAWNGKDEAIRVNSESNSKNYKVKEEPMDDSPGVFILETENGETVMVEKHGNRNNDSERKLRKGSDREGASDNNGQHERTGASDPGRYQNDESGQAVIVEQGNSASANYDDPQKSGDAPLGYRCHICGRKFSVYEVYIEHERSHANEGERPFVCDVCYLSFKSTGSLIAHKRIHTGEKPFSCLYCWKTFRQSATRNRHIKAMHADERRKSQKETMDRISHILSQQVVQYQTIPTDRHPAEIVTSVIEQQAPVVHPISTFTSQPVFPGMTPLRMEVPRTSVDMTISSSYPTHVVGRVRAEQPPSQDKGSILHTEQSTARGNSHELSQSTPVVRLPGPGPQVVTVTPQSTDKYWQSSNPPQNAAPVGSGSAVGGRQEDHHRISQVSPTAQIPETTQPRRLVQSGASDRSHSTPSTAGPSHSPPVAEESKQVSDTDQSEVQSQAKSEARIRDKYIPRHHVCSNCGKNFIGKAALKIHQLVKHMGEKPFACEMCDQRFVSASALITHRRRHTGEKPYKCNICGRAFRHSSTMKRHRLLRHMPQSVQVAYQKAPQKSSADQDQEASDIKHEIKMMLKNQEMQIFDCGLCSGFFSDHADLVRHRISTHQVTAKDAQGGQAILSAWRPSEEKQQDNMKMIGDFMKLTPSQYNVFKRPFQCEECGKAFKVMGHLVMHKRIHSGEKPYKCKVCDRAFRQKGTMSRHMKRHKDWELMKAQESPEMVDQSHEYSNSQNAENAGPSSVGNRLSQEQSVRDNHMETELDEEEDYDEEEDEDEMEEDEEEEEEEEEEDEDEVHDEVEGDYEEEEEMGIVPSSDTMSRTLKTSIMQPLRNRKAKLSVSSPIHMSPYTKWNCNICGKTFGNHWRLERHKMTHSNTRPFPCEYCGKSFRFQSHLAAHLRIHTGEKPFKCNLCGKAFRQSATMHRHRKLHLMKFMPALGLQSNNMQHLLTYLEGQVATTSNPVSQGATTVTMATTSQPNMSTGIANHSGMLQKDTTEAYPVAMAMSESPPGPIITGIASLASAGSAKETKAPVNDTSGGSVSKSKMPHQEEEAASSVGS